MSGLDCPYCDARETLERVGQIFVCSCCGRSAVAPRVDGVAVGSSPLGTQAAPVCEAGVSVRRRADV